jgi:uroporphyrinogen decarboxylase
MTALGYREPDRVPIDYFFFGTPETIAKLKAYLRIEDDEALRRKLGIDIRVVKPRYIGPKLKIYEDGDFEDIWGVVRKSISHGTGAYDEIQFYPLAGAETISDLDKHRWPQIKWWDMSKLSEDIDRVNETEEYAICISNGNIMESSWYMRGLENILTDFSLRPDFAYELLRRVTDYLIEYLCAMLEASKGRVDIVFTADDIADQRGLMMSLDMWSRLVKPHHARMNSALKEYGVKIMYHSDGAVMDAIPGLMEMGIDILDPLQFSARGMDPVELKNKYGDRLCFHGGVDVQTTLPLGTPDKVRKVSMERIKVLGKGGGYIFGPSHAIQEDTPPENIVAMFDEAKNYYYR